MASGTSLALQIGHRKSIDLDFFCIAPFDVKELQIILSSTDNFKIDYAGNNSRMLFGFINNIKCDFINDPATLLEPLVINQGVSYFSKQDIAAMKLHTVCGMGKKKDFFDVYAILQMYSRETMTGWYIKNMMKNNSFFYGAAFYI